MFYTPSHFSPKDKEQCLELIKKNPFATIISCESNQISNITKIPLLYKDGHLHGHLALANPHVKHIIQNNFVQIVFDGPHDYISAKWYLDPTRNVPTWNFASVIVSGEASIIPDEKWVKSNVMSLSALYDGDEEWVNSVDQTLIEKLSKAIVGVSIKILRVDGKFKLSQNRSLEDRENITQELLSQSQDLAQLMSDNCS